MNSPAPGAGVRGDEAALEAGLIEAARSAREKAYAPYSGFKVGAALLCDNGRIFTGCNVENAAYSASICAERVAIGKAVSEGCSKFRAIAIVSESDEPCPPCGFCRQVMAEFNPDLSIIMVNGNGQVIRSTAKELLPLAFTERQLSRTKSNRSSSDAPR